MPKIFPFPSDIPPGSVPFARETISRIEQLELDKVSDLSAQLATDKGQAATLGALSNQLSTLASQQATLAAQQADLTGRVSYAQFGANSYTRNTVGTDALTFGPTVTFTLSETRTVSITGSLNVNIQTRTSNTSNAYATVIGGLIVDGSILGTGNSTRPEITVGGENANGGAISWRGGSALTPRSLLTLGPGSHSVAFRIIDLTVSIFNFGGSPTASVTVNNPAVIVDVLQPA